MATTCTYDQLRHSVMLRANMLTGSQAATLQTTYQVSPLTATQNKSADFPFDHLRDAILQAEQDFVTAVAFTGQHPWRSGTISSATATLGTGAILPAQDATGRQVIGTYGDIYDNATSTAMVEMPLDVITRRLRNANNHYVCPVYYYKISGNRIYHTTSGVNIEVCTYKRSDQVTTYDAAGIMLLPDPAEPGIVARALSFLFRDGAYAAQAAVWRQYSDEAIAAIGAGHANMLSKSVPLPVTQAKAG